MATYKKFVKSLRGIAETVNAKGTFIHGKKADGSIESELPFPQIHLYPFTIVKDRQNGNDTANLFMGFWLLDDMGNSLEQREELISNAEILSEKFMEAMEAKGYYMTGIKAEPQYQSLQAHASGFIITFNLIFKNGC